MPASGVDESRPERARIGDVTLAWQDTPCSGSEASGPPLLLVHGFTGHRDDFIGVAPELARHRRVIAPDLRGHGGSEAPADVSGYSFELLVKDLLGLLDHLGIDRCDLLGHSMGGMVTLRFALAHPDRVRALAFVCTAPEVPAGLERAGFEKAAALAAERGMEALEAISGDLLRASGSPSLARWGPRFWTHRRRRFTAMTPIAYRALGEALFDSGSLVSRLGEIRAPALVLVGAEDEDWLHGAELLAEHLPDARLEVLADAGHHPHQEQPEAFLAALEAHLASAAR